jgi:hypothetical protein
VSAQKIDQKLVEDALRGIGIERSFVFESIGGIIALTGWKSNENPEGDHMAIQIKEVDEEGISLISVQVLGVLHARKDTTQPEQLCQLLQAVSYLNYCLSVVKIGYDPRDGEVRFSVEAPLILGEKVKECIQKTVKVAIVAVDKYKSDLIQIRDGVQSFDEFYKKQVSEKEDFDQSQEVPEPEQRRMLAGLLRSLAELIESEAEGSEVAEKSEQAQGSSAETEND